MKKIFATAALLLTLPLTAFGYSFSEGQNYDKLPARFEKTDAPTLTEVYSVYCGHCYRWEQQLLGAVKEDMVSKKVKFNQAHIAFVADYGDQVSKALLAAEQTGEEAAVKKALFTAIHDERIGDWSSDKQFFATLAKAGLTREEFDNAVKTAELQQKFQHWEDFEKTVPSTPAFIVNGRYLIRMDSLESFDQFYALIDYLLAQP
ncbi:thioredoxin domain-containing protein [Spongorhabdus nitratireducens]